MNDLYEWKNEERAVFQLRALYRRYGYTQYKMSKFEEYDLYSRNKEFLISDSVITFTDTNGKLMALKPDVTLSIIKNGQDAPGCVQKVYYNENVYRVSNGTHCFKEIMQTGLECIGDIDTYCLYEVLMLAAESLCSISADCVLDIAHLGIVSGLLDDLSLSAEDTERALKCIGDKNVHELSALCAAAGADEQKAALLKDLLALYGRPAAVLPRLQKLLAGTPYEAPLCELTAVITALVEAGFGDMIRLDFSVINNRKYYNGIVFKGFVNGVPTGILSGGQYDRLMRKMGRKAGAVGFAVYLDLLEELGAPARHFDIDTVLLYDSGTELAALNGAIARLTAAGHTVTAQRAVPDKLNYRQLLRLSGKEVVTLEEHA